MIKPPLNSVVSLDVGQNSDDTEIVLYDMELTILIDFGVQLLSLFNPEVLFFLFMVMFIGWVDSKFKGWLK